MARAQCRETLCTTRSLLVASLPKMLNAFDHSPMRANNRAVAPPKNTSAAAAQQDAASAPASQKTAPEITGPDWDLVPFEVGCARCGHDLRGLTEPVCPACKLEFDWAEAVPIEKLVCDRCGYHLYGLSKTRCPECGTAFTWKEALATYHRNKNPLFEYQWRNRPIRSLLTTWLKTLRPRKFWQSVPIHDPPRVWPLVFGVVAGCVLLTVMIVLLASLESWLWQSRQWIKTTPGAARNYTWILRPDLALLPMAFSTTLFDPITYSFLKPLLLWLLTSFLALLVFPQSMRACRVRISQVIRVWAYAVPAIVPLTIALAFGASYVATFVGDWPPAMDAACATFVVLVAMWSLRCGYRLYLKMPHSAAIAVASQVIAILSAGALEILVSPYIANTLFFRLLKSLHVF